MNDTEPRWKRRLTCGKQNFWLIIKAWIEYVIRTLVVINEIQWEKVPGFMVFARLLIIEIYSHDVQSYSDSLNRALVSFMANPKMLSPVLRIIYLKTPSYNYLAVNRTMDMTA